VLVLSRMVGQVVVIDERVRVKVVGVRAGRVRLGITAPESVRVDRQEVHDRRELEPCFVRSDVDEDAT